MKEGVNKMRGKRIKVFFYAIIVAIIFIMYPSVKAYASDEVTIENVRCV